MENANGQVNKINYQLALDRIAENADPSSPPSVLLQCCCGPCSSWCLKYLCDHFRVTVLFYNPNIFPEDEYLLRKSELMKLLAMTSYKYAVSVIDCDYRPADFENACSPLADEPEGGKRCVSCFRLRLGFTAAMAKEKQFDYFCSTLTVSPHKNAAIINTIGFELEEQYGVKWLPSDFKKKDGYLNSIRLSKEYGLYRQDYCGCRYSMRK